MASQAPKYAPLDEEFGYSVETHSWWYKGQELTDEEADVIYRHKMDARLARRQQAESEESNGYSELAF
jgi:hypothetical protein